MTSYGRAAATLKDRTVAIELKTLNSKFVDLRLKVPPGFQEKEMELRKVLHQRIQRGKIEATFTFENQVGGEVYNVNKNVFRQYHHQLQTLSEDLGLKADDMLQAIIRLPEVVAASTQVVTEEEWIQIRSSLDLAIDQLMLHRRQEGASAEKDLRKQIDLIRTNLDEIRPYEEERVHKVRQRMSSNLEEYLQRENVDENRFEQEVLFYLEKIDITEEKVRLSQHCTYFLEELDSAKEMKGRKLNFISQEIGREINTLGAKAYSSDIQKLVVLMKDALEKIKEQLANIV